MRRFRALSFLALTGTVLLGLLPQPAVCQINQQSTVSCHMPCCKSDAKGKIPCPFVKLASPQDVIANSSVVVTPALVAITPITLRDFVVSLTRTSIVYHQPQIAQSLFCSTPQTLPAPPPFLA